MSNLRSDNEAPAAPEVLAALADANEDAAHAYGADAWTTRLNERLTEYFERDVAVFPLATGTAANSLALAQLTPPTGAVFCHEEAHIQVDECGAPEFFTGGAKLYPLSGPHGRLHPKTLSDALGLFGFKGDHEPTPGTLSVTQATECGTVYSLGQLRALADVAEEHGMRVHMDGARFFNALASLGCSPAEMTWRSGVDVLSLGGTKNGTLGAEALVFFDPDLAAGFAKRRMKGGHLLSKMRYVSAQLLALLTDHLGLRLAQRANAGAQLIGKALGGVANVDVTHPVEANEVFATLPEAAAAELEEAGFEFHCWPYAPHMYRFVVPWNIRSRALQRFGDVCEGME